ncbi:MAG TPA: hypothetical protein VN920_04275 [Pyrinomonadaceae bacterium]|nr:hypothetical protein [Pyrinomonadaceae bacterium]
MRSNLNTRNRHPSIYYPYDKINPKPIPHLVRNLAAVLLPIFRGNSIRRRPELIDNLVAAQVKLRHPAVRRAASHYNQEIFDDEHSQHSFA